MERIAYFGKRLRLRFKYLTKRWLWRQTVQVYAVCMSVSKSLLIVYHSMTGGTRQMAESAPAGTLADTGVEVRLLHASEAGPDDVLAADGFIFATPENLAAICIVEVEEIVETGDMEPDQVHLPGIYVHRIVHNPNPEKRIEKRTVSEAPVDAAVAKIEAQAAIAQAASTTDEPIPSTIKAASGQQGA